MAAAKDLMQLDLYNLLGIHPDAKEKEIKKAYRKKALSCHPDKNKDNPNAVELFHQLSKALEILTDSAARAAYDRVLKARKAAEIRNKALDSRRKKFKDDLDAREKYSQDQSFDVEANFKNEIDRLRKEGSKQLEEEQEYLRMQLKKINEQAEVQSSEKILPSLSVKWERGKKYTNEELHNIFSKYGQISCIIILNSEKGKALVEFMNSSSAESAFQQEMQFKLKWLQGRPTAKTTGFSFSAPTKETTITNRDYESLTLMKMRQSQERKRLIEQMQKEEECKMATKRVLLMFRFTNMPFIIYIYILFLLVLRNEVLSLFLNETLTVVEGRSVILSCKIPRKLDENLPLHNCTWTRTRTTKTDFTTFLNSSHNSKYISAGNIEAGDCSLNITDVQLEVDEGIWTCSLVVDDKSTPLNAINVAVLVEPLDHILYFNGTNSLVIPNTTIYLDSKFEVTVNLKCISQMGYPPTILIWKLNGEGIIPKSEETYSDIRPSTFMTVSSLQITHESSIVDPFQISCIAFHPTYSGVKILSLNFSVASYAPSSARIQSGCDLKDSGENEIFKIEENQILPLLCLTKGIPLPNVEWEMKDEYNEWKPILKPSLQFAIFIQSSGVYRCVASNKLSEKKAISLPVLVEMEHSKTGFSDSYDDTETHLDPRSWSGGGFLIEPRDVNVVANTSFKLRCILNTPVLNCTWFHDGHVWAEKNNRGIEILNNFENGDCIIYVKSATQGLHDGDWVCQVAFTRKEITRSRHARVVVLHRPTSLILTYEGIERVNGERILVIIDAHKKKVATLRCVANLENKNAKITWWISNRPETFPKTKIKFLAINLYQISSSISLSVNKLPKQTKTSEIFIKCTINNEGPGIVLKIQHPTRKVALFPSGTIYMRRNSKLRLYCKADGEPTPEVTLQRQLGADWQWLNAIPQRKWFTVGRTGTYRCAAKNMLNENYLYSKTTFILPSS